MFVIRMMHKFFYCLGIFVAKRPWLCLVVSTVLTLVMTAKIPFVRMTNDVADFTPYEARAKLETQAYRNFFSNKGEPVVVFVMITAKNRGNMLGVNEMNATVQILDKVSTGFRVFNAMTNRNESFSMFCNNFCAINEPVRHFYSGMIVQSADSQAKSGNSSAHIDLGYPITTVLGRQLHMDPNFFGVKIQTASGTVLSTDQLNTDHGHSIFDDDKTQSPNNLKEIKMVVLQIRAERSEGISKENMTVWEHEIVNYFHSSYKSDYVDVLVTAESFLTSEVVDAGLTLIPFLFIGFVIMCTFSSITMALGALYMQQMNIHKITLAIAACVAPFMACGTGLGIMFWCGLRFGSILCVSPFLVLAIGVDDAYLMINGWQRALARLRKEKQTGRSVVGKEEDIVARLISEVLVDTGPSITITTLTNILAFGFGALTPTPEIQLFSIGNSVAIFIDYVYVWTVYAALMVIVGEYELKNEDFSCEPTSESNSVSNGPPSDASSFSVRIYVKNACHRFLSKYCRLLSNKCVSSFVLALLATYWYVSIDSTMKMKAELKPERLFLESSDVTKILELRNEYVIPYYGVCIVFVNNPGKFSTKFWLRDYEEFMQYSDEVVRAMPEEFEDVNLEDEEGFEFTQNGSRKITLETSPNHINKRANEVQQFLEWPEFRFWKGFVRYDEDKEKNEFEVTKFFFITAFHGAQLRDWSNRAALLNQWRAIADKYADLEVSVFEDDSKFLDIIETMAPLTIQSSIATLVCMVLVCILIIGHASTVFVATTCIGVFGFLSLWGVDLDPIVMSATIMSIGFSVDIPAHIAYHYNRAGAGSNSRRSVIDKTEHCMAAIGFPVLQAGISTLLCVLSLSFVELHMAQVFMKTMVLVITIGLIHGLVVLPVMFSLLATFPSRRTAAIQPPTPSINSITPIMVTVNSSSKV
uniref:SSD domain-containing protein n=1 Tax=Steinernema glaseri TaxID=37863 RepID=A0A1I7ZUL0_9BILA